MSSQRSSRRLPFVGRRFSVDGRRLSLSLALSLAARPSSPRRKLSSSSHHRTASLPSHFSSEERACPHTLPTQRLASPSFSFPGHLSRHSPTISVPLSNSHQPSPPSRHEARVSPAVLRPPLPEARPPDAPLPFAGTRPRVDDSALCCRRRRPPRRLSLVAAPGPRRPRLRFLEHRR